MGIQEESAALYDRRRLGKEIYDVETRIHWAKIALGALRRSGPVDAYVAKKTERRQMRTQHRDLIGQLNEAKHVGQKSLEHEVILATRSADDPLVQEEPPRYFVGHEHEAGPYLGKRLDDAVVGYRAATGQDDLDAGLGQ